MSAVTWMIGTLLSFCLMAVAGRELSGELSTFQILLYRSAFGLVVISLIMLTKKQWLLFSTQRLSLHIVRNSFHFIGQFGWFLAIGLLPLAEVFALEFTVPLWAALIAALFLGEKLTLRKIAALGLGLLGVIVIVQPGYALVDTASLIVLAAALCYAIAHVSTKALSTTEQPVTILFFMCAIQLPIGLLLSLSDWVWPASSQWGWIAIVACTALTAHFCLVKAMQCADVSIVMTLDFLRLPLIAIVGVYLYGESLEWAILVGGFIMLVANLVNHVRSTVVTAASVAS
ncbi:DMT family transporter [Oceanicoccus sp. KOV_DT_Chl]|uniref:DMT family transporter n=1 Tax=Oceanicoccus sp. KOV_DT_Chl TaxID=1904639 RepID=UPI001F3DA833|nr:DMT family transporter [Oceanicoccus sp. KOV_DT_Chl]